MKFNKNEIARIKVPSFFSKSKVKIEVSDDNEICVSMEVDEFKQSPLKSIDVFGEFHEIICLEDYQGPVYYYRDDDELVFTKTKSV